MGNRASRFTRRGRRFDPVTAHHWIWLNHALRPYIADERGLAGAGFWAIGYERGLPGYTEMIAAFRAGKLPPE